MKIIKLLILMFCFTNSFSQKQANPGQNKIRKDAPSVITWAKIVLRDSVSHKAIPNHPLMWFYNKNLKRTDSLGQVTIALDKDSILNVVCHSLEGYYDKTITVTAKQLNYFLDVVPFSADPARSFVNPGKIIDSVFYKNGKIEKRYYQSKTHQNIINYYESGSVKSELINGDIREWYENGKVKHYTIYVTADSRIEGEYDQNGKLTGKGSLSKTNDLTSGKTIWTKNMDWKTYP